MKRTKEPIRIPDAINCSVTKDFTQIPNELLRNPEISGKAKAILCILLSNREGWSSYISTLKQMMKEGEDAIRSGINELEENRYLWRVRYRCKKTKVWKGSFWAYTDIPGAFNIGDQVELIQGKGMEVIKPDYPDMENPDMDNPEMENPGLIILNNKKTNNKNTYSPENEIKTPPNGKITPSQFDKFWKHYPKKIDKGKALTKWKGICSKTNKSEIPTLQIIIRAIREQKKSERWQDPKYIPHPTTWLNQSRWLDDPEQMQSFDDRNSDEDGYDAYAWEREKREKFE